MRYLFALLLTGGLMFADAPVKAHARAKAVKTAKAAAPAGIPDATVEQKIKEKLAKSKAASSNFQVRVQGGVATLEGKANVIQHKGSATRMAKSAGARVVVNNIQITDEARQKAAANLEKGRAKRDQKGRAPVVTRAEVRMK